MCMNSEYTIEPRKYDVAIAVAAAIDDNNSYNGHENDICVIGLVVQCMYDHLSSMKIVCLSWPKRDGIEWKYFYAPQTLNRSCVVNFVHLSFPTLLRI